MMLDIATTAVARGKLYLARQRGEPIPFDWAIDEHGNKTNDPVAGIAGTILPMAGHKGYAIATMIDVLSGVLSGSRFADGVTGPYMREGRSGAGHLAIALNISAFRPLEEFCHDMEQLIAKIKNTPRTPEAEEIFYPGELEARNEQHHLKIGVSIPQDTIAELNASAQELGIDGLT
jgi:LDH2 family malate/lactate/ureidoglycolate dehydrogenase